MSDPTDFPAAPGLSEPFQGAAKPAKPKRPRRTRDGSKRKRFFSLRLTFAEHAALVQAAGDVPLGIYIRSRLFADQPVPENCPRRPRQPVKDQQALAQVLGALGKSRLGNNVNQLARAANSGSLPVTPETEKALVDACAEIAEIRKLLMRGLGFQADGGNH